MDRIPEPELMDDPVQAAAYAAADFAASDQALVEVVLQRFSQAGLGTRLLDLGCGPGNISFRLAAACPAARVLGLDGAGAMLAIARQRQAADPGRWGRLAFRLATLPLPDGAPAGWEQPFAPPFSAVISNSLLHHLHDPGVLWRSLRQLAAPGAAVMVRDLRRPTTAGELEALVALHAATAPAVLRRDFALSLRAAFRADEVRTQLQTAGLPELTVRDVGDRYLEVVGWLD
jgi:trans-aconitate 2-methyltransferase